MKPTKTRARHKPISERDWIINYWDDQALKLPHGERMAPRVVAGYLRRMAMQMPPGWGFIPDARTALTEIAAEIETGGSDA